VLRQRSQRGDHAGAQHAEQRDDAVHGIGKLYRHHGVGLQPELAQPAGKRRYRTVGLCISQLARRLAGQAFAIRRIGQRQRVGVAHAGAAEQVVKRGAVAVGVLGPAQDHLASPCHQVSGR